MADFQATVRGIPELRAELMAIPAKLRKRALRNALAAGARLVQATARLRAPVLKLSTYSGASAFRRGVRKPGTLRKAISVRTSKISSRRGDVGVFVNVRPAKGDTFKTVRSSFLGIKTKTRVRVKRGKRGAQSPNDPYYWRFLEFGTKKMTARPFLGPAAKSKGEEAVRMFLRESLPAIEKLNRKGA
jgi:HK97 gp10 family phage protein